MRSNNKGFSLYPLLIFLGVAVIVYLLVLPHVVDVDAQAHEEQCLENMRLIRNAVEEFMFDKETDFDYTENAQIQLKRMGYLDNVLECPEGDNGDIYVDIHGDYETGVITVKCPNEEMHPTHKLP